MTGDHRRAVLEQIAKLRAALLKACGGWENLHRSDCNDDPPPVIATLRQLVEPRETNLDGMLHVEGEKTVHSLFKEKPTLMANHLCDLPHASRDTEHSIVLRPIIRRKAPRMRALRNNRQGTVHPMNRSNNTVHGNSIAKVVACGVHPLHVVKVRTNGSRSGCPMCEMQIEALCRSAGTARSDHAPRISLDRTRITGCTCGWRTPPGTTDSDGAYSLHAAVMQ